MTIPNSPKLPIAALAGIFSNTTATYKFYWFLSLLDIVVKERKTKVSFWEIIAGMVAESWYPIHYFKLSFGKSDSLYVQSLALQQELNISIDADKARIKRILLDNIDNSRVRSLLRVFTLNVPYRFLSPWITYTTDREVIARSQRFENGCLYALNGETIELNPVWSDYLMEHYGILRDFAFWNLAIFLQKRNPNVPDVPIYTDNSLVAKGYDLDHFIPWSFVSHNLLWNLLPADSSINSSKSNNLPALDKYLKPYARLHHEALRALYPRKPNDKIFEDYLTVYDSVPELIRLNDKDFCNVFQRTFSPMVQIAENMGFKTWKQ